MNDIGRDIPRGVLQAALVDVLRTARLDLSEEACERGEQLFRRSFHPHMLRRHGSQFLRLMS